MAVVGTGAYRARAIGAACAGTVDRVAGVVIDSPNLPLSDTALKDFIEGEFGIPTVVENDVNAALWAESTLGAARGLKHVVMLTLGTGLGGALLLDGRLYRGAQGAAGEIGHTIVDPHGERCRCGVQGWKHTWRRHLGISAFRTVGLFERGAFTGRADRSVGGRGSAAALRHSMSWVSGWVWVLSTLPISSTPNS